MTNSVHEQPAARSKMWWPIVIQTISLIIVAFSYTTAMEHRLTMMEAAVKTNSDILQELKLLNSGQDIRLQLLENNQGRILAIEEYQHGEKGKP